MAQLVIFGAADVARLAYYYFTNDSEHEVVAFCVGKEFRKEDNLFDVPVVDFETVHEKYPPSSHSAFVALGYTDLNKPRANICGQMKELGYSLVSYVSSHCTYLTDEPVGENTMIMEDNTIQPFAKVGNNVIMWSGNHLGHDSVIEDHCFITSHVVISGHCRIKKHSFLGVNATLRDGITIEEENVIGGGAVIMKSTKPGQVYVPERAKLFSKPSSEIKI